MVQKAVLDGFLLGRSLGYEKEKCLAEIIFKEEISKESSNAISALGKLIEHSCKTMFYFKNEKI